MGNIYDDLVSESTGPDNAPQRNQYDDLVSENLPAPAVSGMAPGNESNPNIRMFTNDRARSGGIQQVQGIASASDQEARSQADYLTRPDTIKNVVVPVPALAVAQVVQGVGGKIRQAGDVVGSEGMAAWGKDFAQSGADVEKTIQKEHPLTPGTWANSIRNAGASMYQQLPALVAGGPLVKAGQKALGMATALVPMGAVTGGQSYGKYRDRGFDVGTASAGSAVDELIEVGTELLPAGRLLTFATSPAKLAVKQLAGIALKYNAEEYFGETIAALGQGITNKYLTDPNLTDEERGQKVQEYFTKVDQTTGRAEYLDDFYEAMRATTAQSIMTMGLGSAANRLSRDGNQTPATVPPSPAPASPNQSTPPAAASYQNEGYDDTEDMPAPKGVLETATNQAAVVPAGAQTVPDTSAPLSASPSDGSSQGEVAASDRTITDADQADFENAVLWENNLRAQGRPAVTDIAGEPERDRAWRLLETYRKALSPLVASDTAAVVVQPPSELDQAIQYNKSVWEAGKSGLMQSTGTSEAQFQTSLLNQYRRSQEQTNGATDILPEVQNQGALQVDGAGLGVPDVQGPLAGSGSDNRSSGGLTNGNMQQVRQETGQAQELPPVRGEAVGLNDEVGLRAAESKTEINKTISDSVLTNSKLFGDGPDADTLISQGFKSLGRDSQHVVLSKVLGALNDDKIFRAVVKFVPVNMMNMLVGQQISTQDLLHDKSVLTHRLAVSGDVPIIEPVISFIDYLATTVKGASARNGAKESDLSRVTIPVTGKNDSTVHTGVSVGHNNLQKNGTSGAYNTPAVDAKQAGNYPKGATKATQASTTKPATARRPLDTSKDSLPLAVAKLGGINRAEIDQQTGTGKDLAHTLNSMATKEAGSFLHTIKTAGLPLDTMREALVENGYLKPSDDINTLLDKLDSASRGTVHRSSHSADAGNAAYSEAETRYAAMIGAMTNAEHDEYSRNQWLDEQAGLLAEAGDIIEEYLAGFDDATMTAADWQEVENDLKEALDAEIDNGRVEEDKGALQEDAGGQAEGVPAVGKSDAGGEGPAAAGKDGVKTVEKQEALFATPPTFGKKPQPKTTKDDVSSSDLVDSFTSTESVQPDIFSPSQSPATSGTTKILETLERAWPSQMQRFDSIETEGWNDYWRRRPSKEATISYIKEQKAKGEGGTVQDYMTELSGMDAAKYAKYAEVTPQPEAAAKIEDFGEKIGGARKDYAAKFEHAKTLDIATDPFAKTWPEPDYLKLLADGFDERHVSLVRALRDEIPDKPRKTWLLKSWVDTVKTLRGHAELALQGKSPTLYKTLQETQFDNSAAQNIAGRAELYHAVGHDVSLRGVTLKKNFWNLYKGEKDVTKWQVEIKQKATAFGNMPRELGIGNTKAEALEDFKTKLSEFQPASKSNKPTEFVVYSKRDTKGTFFAGKKMGKDYVDLETFPTAKEAHDYIKENRSVLEIKLAGMKDLPFERRDTNSQRVGEDVRGGKDVTPQMFTDAFKFRGTEFGNWVTDNERQQNLNEAFDALHDLSGVLNIPTQALSLNGELGLAFGARGKGGKRPAAAHYEPDKVVINLTKQNGAGSLAHEWFHAVDSYFSRQRGYKDAFITDHTVKYGPADTTRQELIDAFKKLSGALNETNLKLRSRNLDKARTKDYWSTGIEMHARAFENYVIDKMAEGNQGNDYLANIKGVNEYAEDLLKGLMADKTVNDLYPYLLETEKEKVIKAFDNLFETMQAKPTDKGIALYSNPMLDPLAIVASLSGLKENLQQDLPKLVNLGQRVIGEGAQKFQQFIAGMKQYLGDQWNTFKALMLKVYHQAKEAYKKSPLGNETGAVTIEIGPLLAKLSLEDFIEKAKEIARQSFAGKTVTNKSDGSKILVPWQGIKHAFSRGVSRNEAAVALKLNEVIEAAILDRTEPDKEGRNNIKAVHHYNANVLLEGVSFKVGVVVREHLDGNRYYDHYEIKERPASSISGESDVTQNSHQPVVDSSSASNISPLHKNVNFALAQDQTVTPEFKKWFGNSKVVDESGKPLVVYHGTNSNFNSFNIEKIGGQTDTGMYGKGFYFSEDANYASHYARGENSNIIPAYLKIENPLVIKKKEDIPRLPEPTTIEEMSKADVIYSEKMRKFLLEEGFDGVISYLGGDKEFIVFEPKQIKSATGNNGQFDSSNPDIRYSLPRVTIMQGDSGLGDVTITPAKSLPFIKRALEQENAEQVLVKGGNVDALRKVATGFGKTIVFFKTRERNMAAGGFEDGEVRVHDGGVGGKTDTGRNGESAEVSNDGAETGGPDGRADTIEGFVNPAQPNIIFLNVESSNHLLYITGHELSHSIKMQDPALWDQMAKELKPLVRSWSNFKESMPSQYDNLSEDDKYQELYSDVMGNHFLNDMFWQDMAQENPGLFTKIARKAIQLISKALRLIVGYDVRTYISDLEQSRAIIAKALMQYGENVNKGLYGKFAEQQDLEYLNKRLQGQSILEHLRSIGISDQALHKFFGTTPEQVNTTDESGPQDISFIREQAVSRAIDRAIAKEKGLTSEETRVNILPQMRKTLSQWLDGKISSDWFINKVQSLYTEMENRAAEKRFKHNDRARGGDYIREKILSSLRHGDITQEHADFVEWFVIKNETLLDDLGISVKQGETGISGQYNPSGRIINIFKGSSKSTTGVHEILHHLERMMPSDMQDEVRNTWLKSVTSEINVATKQGATARVEFLQTALDAELMGKVGGLKKQLDKIKTGELLYDDYKYTSPSEYWAVGMTNRLSIQHSGTMLEKTGQWLKEAWEHIKSALKLRSDTALYKAFDSIVKGDGNFNSKDMLGKVAQFDISESSLLGNLKGILEPGTYARFVKNIPDVEDVKDTFASIMANDTLSNFAQNEIQTPLMVTEVHADFLPVYETAKERDENKMDYVVRMLGGLFDKEGKPALWNKIKDTLFNWDAGKETAYGQLLRETKLTSEERSMYDELVFEADIMGAEYSSLAYAQRNARIKKAGVTQRVFDFYQKSMAIQESARKVHIAIIIELMHKAGASLEKIAATLARNHAETEDVSEESLRDELTELMADMEKEGKSIDVIARHVADYRGMVLKRKGRVHRNHGEGNNTVDVYHHITALDFDADTVNQETDESRQARKNNAALEKQTVAADRIRLPGWNFPGNDVVREIKKIVSELDGHFKQTDTGTLIMLFSKGDGAKALLQLKEIKLLDESGAALHKNMVFRRFLTSKGSARKLLRKVERDMEAAMPVHYTAGQKYTAAIGFKEQVSEDMYRDAIGEMATEQILNASINKALAHGEIDKDEAKAMKEAFIQDIAESFMARGAGSYQIRRLNRLIEGYDRTGALGKFESYVQGVSGMLSKAQYSFDQHENLKHVTPEMKDYAYTYIKDSLRNMGTGDQWSGNARAIASFMYLGFNFSWMLVNSTQPYVLGQAELSRETTSPIIKIARAEKDILTGNLSGEEKALFDEMSVRSSDHDSVMNEMAGAGDGGDGKWSRWLGKAVQTSMAVGQKIEVLNRHTMILAAYRVFKGEKGQGAAEALKNALRVNSMVNIDMGRHNLPKFARTAPGRTLYTLASYIQHMLNLLYLRSTGNRTDQKAVLRLLFMMFLLGGLPAGLPGSDELDKLILKFFGYSPKLALKSWTRKNAEDYDSAGEMVDAFIWHGIPGAFKPLGIGVSLTGATQLRIPVISSVIAGDDMTKAVGGPIGGLVTKVWMAGKAAQRHDYWRMTEYLMPTAIANLLSAIRQAIVGVKTASGKRVDYKGKQLKMQPHEAAIRAFGLQPVRTADISETRGFEFGIRAEWNDRRTDALNNYRMTRKLKYIQEFNRGLRGSQAQGLVSPISPESLANVWGKTNKKKSQWQREHGAE